MQRHRELFDYPDKQLSIIPTEYWPHFERYRKVARAGGEKFEGLSELEEQAKDFIETNGAVSSSELPLPGKMRWHSHIHWSGEWGGESNAARSVLEQLYSTGELVIHHKKGTRKYYDLAKRHIPSEILSAPEPFPEDFEHQKWRMLRRIGSIGLIWNRPSGFWINVWNLTADDRNRAFQCLEKEGEIFELRIEDLRYPFYVLSEDMPVLEQVLASPRPQKRCELIAPLDPLLWDKNLIKAIFGFEYRWEIYTPDKQRKYGAYVLPMLYGDGFIGRVEAINDRKTKRLLVKNIWYEGGTKGSKTLLSAVENCLKRFAKFNECETVDMECGM